jgi:hypothetical protein
MLSIYLDPSYEGISIRPVSIPRDSDDLTTMLKRIAFHPLWSLQPQESAIENSYIVLLRDPTYSAFILSYHETTLFMLEILPMSHTEFYQHYQGEPYDYFLQINLSIDASLADKAVRALRASLEGIAAHPEIRRLIFPVYFSEPASLLREILEKAGFVILKDKAEPALPVIYAYLLK